MSSNFTVKRSDNIGTSLASIGGYTLAANTGAIVVGLTVSNTSTQQVFANVVVNNGSNNFYIIKNATIPANGTLIAVGQGQKIVLQAGDTVQVNSSLSSSVDAMLSVMESTEVGLTVD